MRVRLAECKGALYRIVGEGWTAGSGGAPQRVMIYAQTDHTTLRRSSAEPPVQLTPGTLWVRPLDDFRRKFREFAASR